jgi:hypothetical protein
LDFQVAIFHRKGLEKNPNNSYFIGFVEDVDSPFRLKWQWCISSGLGKGEKTALLEGGTQSRHP